MSRKTLKFVIRDSEARLFSSNDVYENLWYLQRQIEDYAPVGAVVSGSLMAPIAAIFVLPTLAGTRVGKRGFSGR